MEKREIIYNKNVIDTLKGSKRERPIDYLSKYLFSKEILLDIFCSEELVYCYEDYYYYDIDLSMIEKYQPHIDIEEFEQLWHDLDEVRTAILYCRFIVNKPITGLYRYDIITKYSDSLDPTELLNNFGVMLEENRYIQKYHSDIILSNQTDDIFEKATLILSRKPQCYSSILPL